MKLSELSIIGLILIICQQVVQSKEVENQKNRIGKLLNTERHGKHLDLGWLGKVINDIANPNNDNSKPRQPNNNPYDQNKPYPTQPNPRPPPNHVQPPFNNLPVDRPSRDEINDPYSLDRPPYTRPDRPERPEPPHNRPDRPEPPHSRPDRPERPVHNPPPNHNRPPIPNHQPSPNENGERCLTPNMEAGFCRLVEDCPIRAVIQDYSTFLRYSCTVGKHGVGICCPSSYRGEDKPKPSTSRPTTSRPQTNKPTTARPANKPTPKPTPNSTAKPNSRKSLIDESKSDCGYSPKTRIVGGKDSKKDQWPWAVPIFNQASYKDQFCGGALITRRHVLTAAHCMVNRKPKEIYVRVGAYNIQEEDDTENAFNVVKIVSNSQYNNVTNANDISILTLEKDVPFNANSNPVCIPDDSEDYVKQNATVIGWGTTSYAGTSSSILQEVTIPVWNLKDCQNVYGKDKQICAGLKEGGKDSCQGDSGGPLLRLSLTRRRFEVIGVVSYGFRCAEPGNPGVYTKVNRYYKWIENETRL